MILYKRLYACDYVWIFVIERQTDRDRQRECVCDIERESKNIYIYMCGIGLLVQYLQWRKEREIFIIAFSAKTLSQMPCRLFPRYFQISAVSLLAATATAAMASKLSTMQYIALGVANAGVLANLLFLEPEATAVMFSTFPHG